MGTLRRCVRKSTPNTERADSHKCVFPPHWQMRWHEAHDCISVTVDLTQPLDSERHSQQHSRMCIQIFSQLISYTLSFLTHTYSNSRLKCTCFYTLSCGAKHISIQGLGSLLKKKKQKMKDLQYVWKIRNSYCVKSQCRK